MKLTTRGVIVLIVIPILLVVSLFTYVTRDTCYVGTDKPYANFLGYGSCSLFIDDAIQNNPQTTTTKGAN
jgi:hypothetical protein